MNDEINSLAWGSLERSLEFIYPGKCSELLRRFRILISQFQELFSLIPVKKPEPFTAKTSLVIAYPDMIFHRGMKPLTVLKSFMDQRLASDFSHVHVLPFFPSSSDEGFSVMNFHSVDTAYGDWQDMEALGEKFNLVFDLVLNHASARGIWFQNFLSGTPPFDNFFVTRPQETDTSLVFRPRTHPLLTPYTLKNGKTVFLWTTFSPDQVDLDLSNPEVLLAMAKILLEYVSHGAKTIRLDAVAFAWKQEGTQCLDLPQVHHLVKVLRAVLDLTAPGVTLLSETNLPQLINDSYFGAGDEAQLVYRFTLPPLALHAFVQGKAERLILWASQLPAPDPRRTYVNFLSSHDGIGVTPARELLSPDELYALTEAVKHRGGLVSSRSTPEGPVAYELNTTFLSAIADPSDEEDLRIRAFLSAHALMTALDGIPAFWFHSLVGSLNWPEGPQISGSNRSIHRQRLEASELVSQLNDPTSPRSRVFKGITALLARRSARGAFDPGSPQEILASDPTGALFAMIRGRGAQAVLTLVNVSKQDCEITLPETFHPLSDPYDPTSSPTDTPLSFQGTRLRVQAKGVVWVDGNYQGGNSCT